MINKAGVELEQGGPSIDFFLGVRRGHDATYPDDGNLASHGLMEGFDDFRRPVSQGGA